MMSLMFRCYVKKNTNNSAYYMDSLSMNHFLTQNIDLKKKKIVKKLFYCIGYWSGP